MPTAILPRSILRLSGDNLYPWLGGLMTNTIRTDGMTFAALLTPQGKIIADFFLHPDGDDLLLETPEKFAGALQLRLKMYKLREKIEITDVSGDQDLVVRWGDAEGGHADSRHDDLGTREIVAAGSAAADASAEDYDRHRLSLSIPDSQHDFDGEQVFTSDTNMDEIGGIDFRKGCFVGQEVVSRLKRKTEVRKRMRALKLSGPAAVGDTLKSGERNAGDILHVNGDLAMALVRLDRLDEPPSVNGAGVEIL